MNTFGAKSLQRRSSERWGLMGLHACLRTRHGSLEHLASLQLRGGGGGSAGLGAGKAAGTGEHSGPRRMAGPSCRSLNKREQLPQGHRAPFTDPP